MTKTKFELPSSVTSLILPSLEKRRDTLRSELTDLEIAIEQIKGETPKKEPVAIVRNNYTNPHPIKKRNGKKEFRRGMIDKIANILREAKKPLRTSEVSYIIAGEYGVPRSGAKYVRLRSTVSSILGQYVKKASTSGIQFDRTLDNKVNIYSIKN